MIGRTINRTILLLSVTLLFGCEKEALVTSASSLPEVISIPYKDFPSTVDASPDAWDGVSSIVLTDTVPPPMQRNTLAVSLAWDEQFLHALYRVEDKTLCAPGVFDSKAQPFMNDGIEFWIDAKDDSRRRINVDDFHFIVDVLDSAVLFRGDKRKMLIEEYSVPQEAGNTPMVYYHAIRLHGTLNDTTDVDTGYTVALKIPWAAIGIEPREGKTFKIDACMNDQDSLGADPILYEVAISRNKYFALGISGTRDFGYPDDWRHARLAGHADFITILSRTYHRVWLLAFILVSVLALLIIAWLSIRIIRLRQLPEKKEIEIHPVIQTYPEPRADPALSFKQQQIVKARRYVEAHITEPLGSDQVSRHLAISARSLQRLIKDELNTTPSSFIHIVRLERAASMLAHKQCNVTEAAYAVGFTDAAYFSRLFKRYYGISPSHYTGLKPEIS